jgi:RNA polymerase sigma-70 factor (ECF subfamily)
MNSPHDIPRSSDSRPSSGTPRSLLDRVRANDPAAWERMVALYAPLVFHWCRRYALQDADAADVAQEVFRAVLTHVGGFRKEKPTDTYRGWLRTIFRNKVHDHFRRRGREPAGVGGSDAQAFLARRPDLPVEQQDDPSDQEQESRLLRRALTFLHEEFEDRTWRAFWQTVVDGRATNEVAADLGMSSGAVRVARCRVLQRLRDFLGDVAE